MIKLLLDENIPLRLRQHFSSDFEVYTVKYCGWESLQNGKLLAMMAENGFHAMITTDKNLQFQQNLEKYKIRILVLNCEDNQIHKLIPFVPFVEKELKNENRALAVLISKE